MAIGERSWCNMCREFVLFINGSCVACSRKRENDTHSGGDSVKWETMTNKEKIDHLKHRIEEIERLNIFHHGRF